MIGALTRLNNSTGSWLLLPQPVELVIFLETGQLPRCRKGTGAVGGGGAGSEDCEDAVGVEQ